MRKFYLQTIVLLFLKFSLLNAQPGSLDQSFNYNDFGRGAGDGATGMYFYTVVRDIAIQPDGKFIIVGDFNSFNSYSGSSSIVRLEADGTIDFSFSSGNNSFYGRLCAIQPDGKILVVGVTTSNQYCIYRFNSNGSLDNTFNTGSGTSGAIRAIAIQSDGKILVGGDFTNYNGTACNRILRLNTDGSIDNSFNVGTGANYSVYAIAITSTNKILVGGAFTQFNGTNKNAVAYLNNDGSFNTIQYNGFSSGSVIKSIFLETNGGIVFGGNFSSYYNNSINSIVRLNGLGQFDNTFTSGFSSYAFVNKITKSTSGKYYICGSFYDYSGHSVSEFICLNNDGTFNSVFYHGVFNNSVEDIVLQPDNKIIVAGAFIKYDNYEVRGLTRLNTDGTRDIYFNPQSGLNNVTRSIAVLPDKKMIVGGDFTLYNGKIVNYLIKIHENGALDTTFNANNVGADNDIYSVVVQPDQKILIGGDFSSYNGVTRNKIARLNPDGTLDQSFNPGSGANWTVRKILLQDDGKIVLVGDFTQFNGITVNRIVRLNANGSIDLTFNPGTGADFMIHTIVPYQNGKYLIAGNFTSYNNNSVNRLACINSDGTLDPTFNIGTGPNSYINCLAVQNDGKIYVGGTFTTFNGTNIPYFVRLNSDGSIDTGFNQGSGFNNSVNQVLLLSDGSILVSGYFTQYNQTIRQKLLKLAPSGMLDPSFDGGSAADRIYVMTQHGQGRIMIGGEFINYDIYGRNRLARILNCYHTYSTINVTACDTYTAPDGQVYNTSGTYMATIPNSTGCDSTITIYLTILQSTSVITDYIVCNANSFTAPDGQVYTTDGTYTAIIPNSVGCDSVITFYLTFTPFVVQATLSNDTLTASPDYGVYQWLDCNNNYAPIPGATQQTFVPNVSGSYAVRVATMECTDTSDCVNVILSNIADKKSESIFVYPNPTTDNFVIQISDGYTDGYYEIFNSVGERVAENRLLPSTFVNVKEFESGLYLLKITHNKNVYYRKVIVK